MESNTMDDIRTTDDSGEDDVEFNSSELGTKKYWDESYKKELHNFEDHGDIGEIWFGEESILRVINWITSSKLSEESSIIDIGCGNGILLSYLADEGFKNLYGVDYSKEAILLAEAVAKKRDTPIKLEDSNIVEKIDSGSILNQKYDIVHDKGTFDAISLSPENAANMMKNYIENVTDLLNSNSVYILTSCNWTEHELISKFSNYMEKVATIPTPVFQFGGKTGSTVTSLVFRKKR